MEQRRRGQQRSRERKESQAQQQVEVGVADKRLDALISACGSGGDQAAGRSRWR